MGFTIETGISAVTVFIQGLLSFFSPCVLPLVPLYLGYLAGGLNVGTGGGAVQAGDPGAGPAGPGKRERLKLFIRVLFFTLGISGAFFVLGMGASAAGSFFNDNRMLFARIGGVLVVLFGLYQLGVFGSSKVLGSEHRLPLRLEKMTMSPVTALIMGFAFSFAWTPCVGPALTSVLLMAGSAETGAKGFLLIGVYTLGFILPFLAAGIFTAGLLAWFKKHMKIVRYTVKVGGVLMILMGLLMFTGKMNDITGYLSSASQSSTGTDADASDSGKEDPADGEGGGDAADSDDGADAAQTVRAYEFEMEDQFGNVHRLDDYKGKVIFLNFWATWCGPCRNEMPEIQMLYEEYAAQGENAEVAVIGVAGPGMGGEGSREEITAFMEENGYTYPVLMDETGEMFSYYGISAFPTTFMIDRDGNVYGYVSGQLTEDIMRSIIDQTLEGDA
ncbi:MAG TPA: redoxin domain-containing protein [Candidatus Mediterraneibacter tabaqchaliae]|uniref:Redoxin domain-containing protein n=1 Tax=Candidatus Mediterraneibacter tabaqchaliae TaxID=2838689 RepID=A0A9D2R1A6_9FIRM|nr:redoxin domain-containing protein [Candidatus Mediterraneibacter tabaqchaliae]